MSRRAAGLDAAPSGAELRLQPLAGRRAALPVALTQPLAGQRNQQPAASGLQPRAKHLVPRKTSRWRGSEKVHFHHRVFVLL